MVIESGVELSIHEILARQQMRFYGIVLLLVLK